MSVSIHATLAGGDFQIEVQQTAEVAFLSTPPSRVATQNDGGGVLNMRVFLSTPPSRVATDATGFYADTADVSIHATLAGGDLWSGFGLTAYEEFLSTPPSRVATR